MKSIRVDTAAVPRRSRTDLLVMEAPVIGDVLLKDVIVLITLAAMALANGMVSVIAALVYVMYMMWRNSTSEKPFKLLAMLQYRLGFGSRSRKNPPAEFADLPLDPVPVENDPGLLPEKVPAAEPGDITEDVNPEKTLVRILTSLENPKKSTLARISAEVGKRKTRLRGVVECTPSVQRRDSRKTRRTRASVGTHGSNEGLQAPSGAEIPSETPEMPPETPMGSPGEAPAEIQLIPREVRGSNRGVHQGIPSSTQGATHGEHSEPAHSTGGEELRDTQAKPVRDTRGKPDTGKPRLTAHVEVHAGNRKSGKPVVFRAKKKE